ncbi:MAG: cytochrome P450 [Microthrixaceae bacterium]|nr:cytochrome P450 [Microthrixaceae bacterium]MCO5314252.1 cytochrome P450 [Microthrixaceae bacterium]
MTSVFTPSSQAAGNPAAVDLSKIDFTDATVFDDPWDIYAALRELDHLHYDAINDLYIAPRHEDIFHISRNNDIYVSRYGVRPKIAGDMSIITLDGPEHIATRRLINAGFTPRRVRAMMPHIRELAGQLIDDVIDSGHIDFVEQFAIHVPLIIICELMGLDPAQRMDMYRWSDQMMAGDGHVDGDDPVLLAAAEAFGEFAVLCMGLIAERREDPKDDLISILTKAYDEGGLEREHEKVYQGVDDATRQAMLEKSALNDDELFAFLAVLMVAGNETTRNAITGGLLALSEYPEQKQLMIDNLFNDEFMDPAIEELIRYVTPVLGFVRTVEQDHTYRNTDLKKGDRVLMLYAAANRDERAISNPDVLDFQRPENPHMAFGIGPHYCLGANLARMEVKLVFQELLSRMPDITVPAGAKVPRGESSLVLALQHMPADFTAGGCPVAH